MCLFTQLPREVKWDIFDHIHFQDYKSCLLTMPDFISYVNLDEITWRLLYEKRWKSYKCLDSEEIFLYIIIPKIDLRYLSQFRSFLKNLLCTLQRHPSFQNALRHTIHTQHYANRVFEDHGDHISLISHQLTSIISCIVTYWWIEDANDNYIHRYKLEKTIWQLVWAVADFKGHPKHINSVFASKTSPKNEFP